MTRRPDVPPEVRALAEARARARAAHEWPEADRLRAEIEAAGWRIVDRGTAFELTQASPPDVVAGGTVRYGSSEAVPSRLADTPVGGASVVVVADDWPDDLERCLAALAAHAPEGTQVVVVANDPSPAQAERLAELERAFPERPVPEGSARFRDVVWTSARLGHAAALNVGIRRAASSLVVLLDPSIELTGDAFTPLRAALDDPSIAVVGPFGIVSNDLREFSDAPAGDVVAIEGYCQAFRRADYGERGPLDEHFRFYRNLDIWWSLVLRDAGESGAPRRAFRVADLPLVRHEHRGYASLPPLERERLSKRNFYRILDRFRNRRDLLVDR